MNATHTFTSSAAPKSDLTVIHVLAELLERLEHTSVPVDPGQYLGVVGRLVDELRDAVPGLALRALLDTHPAAAELYENVNYQYAGLCRSALDASLASELQARQALAHAMRPAENRSPTPTKEDPKHGKS